MEILAFWLETAYSHPFWGNISPIWHHPSSWPPKGPPLGRNTWFEPFSVRISATVRLGRVTKKEKHYNKTVTKVLYFPYLGGSLRWADSTLTLHGGWCPRHNQLCRVSNWNLHGLRFYRRSNFQFSNWLLHVPYNSAALMRCPWLCTSTYSLQGKMCVVTIAISFLGQPVEMLPAAALYFSCSRRCTVPKNASCNLPSTVLGVIGQPTL